jgi:type 2 lantibiotic biosynthesis protein LanM
MNSILFQDQIEKILRSSNSHTVFDLDETNRQQILGNIAYISKFAFDKEYNGFKSIAKSFQYLFQISNTIEKDSVFNTYLNDFESQDFIDKFPLLPSLFKQKIGFTSNYINTIHDHFSIDRKKIAVLFNESEDVGEIINIKIDLGDVHQGGKTTAIVYFKNDLKLVYKARSSGMDIAFNNLINNINHNCNCIDLKTICSLDKESYSWTEFIENKSCDSIEEIFDYYRRCGVLTALIYLLKGTDMHFENIIAAGSYPFLIDLECLFNTNCIDFNVLHIGLLPVLTYSDNSSVPIDLSGFGASGVQESSTYVWKWKDIGSDDLNLIKDKGKFEAKSNQPNIKGVPVSPEKFVEEFSIEFKKVCDYFISIQSTFDDEVHLFSEFKDKQIRVIPRPTQVYKDILENSYIPEALISKEKRDAVIEQYLNDFPLIISFKPKDKIKIMAHELRAIQQMDIPYFTSSTTDKFLLESNNFVLEEFNEQTPFNFILKEIKELDQSKIDRQLQLIQSAFSARYNIQRNIFSKLPYENSEEKSDIVYEEIKDIALNLKRNSELNQGSYSWYSFESLNNQNLTYANIDNSLYSGTLGIVLYLSAASKFLKTDEYEAIIESILSSQIETALANNLGIQSSKVNISYSTGISGLIYCLLTVNPIRYKQSALELSRLITMEMVIENNKIDIMAGVSGCLLVLMKLFSLTQQQEILDKCILIGNHIDNLKYLDTNINLLTWNSDTLQRPLTGFSHGVSGIGYAMLKLYEVTNIQIYKTAFYDAVKYENHFYNKEQGNWADLRESKNKFQNSWCYGASGIGLNRLYAYKLLNDKTLLLDIQNAIEVTKKSKLLDSEFYCCGNVGRLDFLIEASKVLNDQELNFFVKEKLNEILEKKNESRYYQTFANKNISIENPSLFRGVSGIGLVLIRSVDPNNFQCFGLLE